MEPHQHTVLGWLNHHWAFISLVCFPAFMCYLNALAIFMKKMGATKLADWLAKLEDALTATVAAVKSYKQNQGGVNEKIDSNVGSQPTDSSIGTSTK